MKAPAQIILVALIGFGGLFILTNLPDSATHRAPIVDGPAYRAQERQQKQVTSLYKPSAQGATEKGILDYVPVRVGEIAAIFDDNEVRGEQQFRGITLMEGTIAGIQTGLVDGARMEFAGHGFLTPVLCSIEQENVFLLANLHKGQHVRMLGHDPRRYLGTVVFQNCTPTTIGVEGERARLRQLMKQQQAQQDSQDQWATLPGWVVNDEGVTVQVEP